MKIRNRVLSGITACAMMATMVCGTAFAAGSTAENGNYQGTIHMHNASNPANYSMCDAIFARTADVELTDDSTVVTFYVAMPIPAFPDQGTDGTITNVSASYNEETYGAELDIETLPEKYFDTASSLFGVSEGDELPCEAVKFTLPAEAVDTLADGLAVSAYVNVVMNSQTDFVMKITDLEAVKEAAESSEQSMEITATVEETVSEASYTVTIPSSVAFGALSSAAENTKDYNVEVKAENMAEGAKIEVSAPGEGTMTSGSDSLAFANSFGTQEVTGDTESAILNGTMTVSAADVAAAAAGNYTGTTSFTISYYAE